ncbi:MAG: hypothetical protein JWO05_1050 [Gemmatimonadetes bacterium]|nr:hypothetical protein [Gemmatimonadota bacterium]
MADDVLANDVEGAANRPACFVIMPISDPESYSAGHFRRVYEFLIKPACNRAGFQPIRADDVYQANHIVLDVLQRLLHADMAICDLSARNPNVFYELGMRQAFNRPVTLIKDLRSPRVFDIQGLRDIEYDEGLRVDTIEPTIEAVAESLANTWRSAAEAGGQVNSLVQLLGLHAATPPQLKALSPEGSLVLAAVSDLSKRMSLLERAVREPNLRQGGLLQMSDAAMAAVRSESIASIAEALQELSATPSFTEGQRICHRKFGNGTVLGSSGFGRDEKVKIDFDDEPTGRKTLIVQHAHLQLLNE